MDKKEELRMELSNDILRYIEKEMEKGFNEEEIKRALFAVGHEEEIINHHLTHFKKKKEEKIASKQTRKKYMIAILSLSIIVVLTVAIYLAYTTKNVTVTTTPSIPSEIKTNNISNNATNVKEEPKQTSLVVGLDGNKNLSVCDNAVDKEACITTTNLNIAIASLKPTECANTANAQACEVTIYMALAKQKEDVAICNSIEAEDLKNDCIRFTAQAVAIKQKNSTICNLIADETAKQICIDVSK